MAKVNLLNRERITVSPQRITRLRLGDTEFSLPNRITRVRLGDTGFSLLKCITKGKKANLEITATKFSKTPVIRFHYKNVSPISLLKCITNFVTKVYHQGKKGQVGNHRYESASPK